MKPKIVKLIAYFMKYSRWLVVISILSGLLAGSSSAILMMLINARVVGSIDITRNSVIAFALLAVLVLVATVTSGFISNLLAQNTSAQLRMYICRRILGCTLKSIEEAGANRVLASLTQDITVIIGALLRVPGLFINLAIVVGGMAYLGWLSLTMLLVLIGFVVFSIASYMMPQKTANRYVRLARDEYGTMVSHFRALLLGGKELRLHRPRRTAFFSEVFEPTAVSLKRFSLLGDGIYVLLTGWSHTLYFVVIGLILFALPVLLGDVSLKTLTAYALTVLYISGPIQTLVGIVPAFSQANISLRKLEELGVTLSYSEIAADEGPLPPQPEPTPDWSLLELAGVGHTYFRERESSNFVLGPIDLTFRPGELTFLVGGNGSGKTTLAKLLCGLYIPEGGEIKINGVPVTEKNIDDYRQYFSVVFTEFHIFEKLLGIEKIELDERANEYLVELQLDKMVTVVDGKLSTTKLSYGQQKRLALLTAYLEDRPIYIFDEWAADQDPHFKNIFYNHILPSLKAKGKLVIVISHDDRYYYVADRIVKLEYGKIILDEYQKETVANVAQSAVSDHHLVSSSLGLPLSRSPGHLASVEPGVIAKLPENGNPSGNGSLLGAPEPVKDEPANDRLSAAGQDSVHSAPEKKGTAIVLLSLLLIGLLVGLTIRLQRPPSTVSVSAPLEQFSSGRAMQHLKVIAQQAHPLGSDEQRNVGRYIAKVVSDVGITPEIQQAVVVNQGPRSTVAASVQNVVARLKGTGVDPKAIMLVAHYDSIPHSRGASDDGAGVVTLLETLRALKAGPALRNDVVFLFTDGEEFGSLGAKAFADEHQWAKDIGLVLNFEARGSEGPVYMFETGEKNGRLINEFGKAAPHPFASSLMYSIYKLLPNDTDFTVFKRKGLTGFNFAYIGGANRYHTVDDSLETIDERSLQHHGSYALALTNHFGNLNLDDLKSTDAIYFDVLGVAFLSYSQAWAIPLAVFLFLLFGATMIVGLRKKSLTLGGVALGFILNLVIVVLASTAVALVWKGITILHSDYTPRSNSTLYAAGLMSLACCITTALYLLVRRWTGWNNLITGVLAGWLAMAVLSSIFLPGASHLFLWPLLFSLVALAVSFFFKDNQRLLVWFAIVLVSTIPGILLITSTTYSVFQGMALAMPAVLVFPGVMLLGLLLPYLKHINARYRWLLPAASLLVSVVFLILGNITPVYNQNNRRQDSIVYDLDADTGHATWLSNDTKPDEWTAQFFTAVGRQPPAAGRTLLRGSAPAVNLEDEVTVLDDTTTENGRSIHLRLSSSRKVRSFSVYVDPSVQITSAVVNGKRLESTRSSSSDGSAGGWNLSYLGVPEEGIDLLLETKSTGDVKLKLGSYSDGLPEIPNMPRSVRPSHLIPATNSDVTHVSKTYDLGAAAQRQK